VFHRSNYGKTVTVYVGPNKEPLTIYEDIFDTRAPNAKTWERVPAAPYHAAGPWSINLPTTEVSVFKLYLDYTNSPKADPMELALERMAPRPVDAPVVDAVSAREPAVFMLIDLWILSDVLGDSACKNEVIDSLVKNVWQRSIYLRGHIVNEIFDRTSPSSLLRNWTVDTLVPGIPPIWLKAGNHVYRADFMAMALALARVIELKGPVDANLLPTPETACRYHDHRPNEPRCG
jgi:hypothetical protein